MKCMNCEKELIRRQKKFCSSICQMDKQYKDYIERWKDGKEDGTKGIKVIELSSHVKRYLLEKYANRCQKCGWGRINTYTCLLYTSPSPRDQRGSRMPSSA